MTVLAGFLFLVVVVWVIGLVVEWGFRDDRYDWEDKAVFNPTGRCECGLRYCGFCEMGKPLDTQEDWDRSWGRTLDDYLRDSPRANDPAVKELREVFEAHYRNLVRQMEVADFVAALKRAHDMELIGRVARVGWHDGPLYGFVISDEVHDALYEELRLSTSDETAE